MRCKAEHANRNPNSLQGRITDIHLVYGGDIYSTLRAQILAAVKNEATQFETEEFFIDRARGSFADVSF